MKKNGGLYAPPSFVFFRTRSTFFEKKVEPKSFPQIYY